MAKRARTCLRSDVSSTLTANPASRKCRTQPVQQPQFGSLCTTATVGPSAKAAGVVRPAAAISRTNDRRVI